MKNQALFSSKDKSKKLKCRLLQFLFGTSRVKRQKISNPKNAATILHTVTEMATPTLKTYTLIKVQNLCCSAAFSDTYGSVTFINCYNNNSNHFKRVPVFMTIVVREFASLCKCHFHWCNEANKQLIKNA